jgi:hypothetical protein
VVFVFTYQEKYYLLFRLGQKSVCWDLHGWPRAVLLCWSSLRFSSFFLPSIYILIDHVICDFFIFYFAINEVLPWNFSFRYICAVWH